MPCWKFAFLVTNISRFAFITSFDKTLQYYQKNTQNCSAKILCVLVKVWKLYHTMHHGSISEISGAKVGF